MIRSRSSATLIPVMIGALFVSISQAATIGTFDFDNDAPFSTTTPFTDTSNGISATFTSPSDPGAFAVLPSSFQALSGNALTGTAPGVTELDIAFNQSLVAATFTFATSDFITPGPLDLEALYNGTPVGSTSATGIVPAGFIFPEGEIAFEGAAFNQLVVTTPDSPTFAIDNLNVAEAPEPSSASMIVIGLLVAFAPVAIRRARNAKLAASRVARTAVAAGAAIGIAGAATPALLPLPATSASTVPSSGDVNPYGVAFVPSTVPQDGILKPGAILISNFNNALNLQGTGRTIVQVDRSGNQTLFFGSSVSGTSAALGILSDGLVLAGNLPSLDGTPATASAGSIQVITRQGQLLGSISDPTTVNGPWGMAIYQKGQGLASIFISNVLNGTISRLDISENGMSLSILKKTIIASGLAHRPDPAAFEVGPSGLAFDATHDILYFADSDDNNIYALDGAAAATGTIAPNLIYSDLAHLHGPLDLVLLATGDLMVANSDGSNGDPNQPSELVEFNTAGQFVAEYSLDPNNGGAFGLAVNYLGFSAFEIAAVDDNQNVVKIWTETVN